MKSIKTLALILVLAVLAFAQTINRPRITAVRCGRLIDVKSGNLSTNVVILIEGEQIIAVGPSLTITYRCTSDIAHSASMTRT